jgi:methyl-accepting chemotaxis protein
MKTIRTRFTIGFSIFILFTIILGTIGVIGTFEIVSPDVRNILRIVIIVFSIIIIVLTIFYCTRLINLIVKPIILITNTFKEVRKTGDFITSQEQRKVVREVAKRDDEISALAGSLGTMMDALREKIYALRILAQGDMTNPVPLVSNTDTLGLVINEVVTNLNSMVSEVKISAEQLSLGINQLSSASQSLAQSTAEQSATVEELFAAVNDIAAKAEENAEKAGQATALAEGIRGNVTEGSEQMLRMTQAMDDINTASKSIGTVMKVIDEITFQTNILSLNAAVEAARAGQHGKGFAVVADEVRSLASRSANAAGDSNTLIENTLSKSRLGTEIVKETSDSLKTILDGVANSTAVVNQIAKSSAEQNIAIDDVNQGINQLTSVVYQNSATAEESAAATDEMQSQIGALLNMVGQFKISEDDSAVPDALVFEAEVASNPVPATQVQPEPELEPQFQPVESKFIEEDIQTDAVTDILYDQEDSTAVPFVRSRASNSSFDQEENYLPDDDSKY